MLADLPKDDELYALAQDERTSLLELSARKDARKGLLLARQSGRAEARAAHSTDLFTPAKWPSSVICDGQNGTLCPG